MTTALEAVNRSKKLLALLELTVPLIQFTSLLNSSNIVLSLDYVQHLSVLQPPALSMSSVSLTHARTTTASIVRT